ncbi:DUF5799 family protein [Natronobacterium gregoryi]|uniref:Uncharacterized protein n=2 Tax=Natronobacterium gregoryi TaxID=44930 RepID=L0AJD5_NATGS|nr:DUF5799 family protein [Natronobacterium gregoryi]AFZ73921.1 hypothetical protein Natgr_2776 [Natronobacterium gregoryi SP2]PLK19066.1 hypothetical protein CYV19_16885 [Natronobacterium gregoryi SP2]SFJ63232.1 hypothetical protein SAMN05443661_14917 [Natronobacterium gregoryi]
MSERSWTDRIVGERMTVDQEFSSRIASSELSNQQWSLIMTATEFEIERPDDPDRARIVANTEQVEQIIPELENVDSGMGAMGGPGARGGGSSGSGGLVDSIKGALGLGGDGGDHDEKLETAERLTEEYARELQTHLEENGRWDSVREAVAERE